MSGCPDVETDVVPLSQLHAGGQGHCVPVYTKIVTAHQSSNSLTEH